MPDIAPDAPISGTRLPGSVAAWASPAEDAADEEEGQEADPPEPVLHVVAEDPQEQHVEAQVDQVGVQEDGS